MAARFVLDPSFERRFLASPEVGELIAEAAAEAAERARAMAPDDPATTTDDLKSSVYGDVALTPAGWRGRVGATDYKAHWKEFGSSRERAQPFIRPAVEEVVGPIEAVEGDEDA